VAGVLELVKEHHLVPGPFHRADLGVPGGYPGGQRHLVAVVHHLTGGLRRDVPGYQGQQLFAGALALQDLPDRGGHPARQRPARRFEPVTDLDDVARAAQVLGEFPGQIEHGRGDRLRAPVDRVHGPGVGGDHPGRRLPRDRRGDQAHRRLQRLPQRMVGDQPGGVGMVGGHDRLTVQQAAVRLLRPGLPARSRGSCQRTAGQRTARRRTARRHTAQRRAAQRRTARRHTARRAAAGAKAGRWIRRAQPAARARLTAGPRIARRPRQGARRRRPERTCRAGW